MKTKLLLVFLSGCAAFVVNAQISANFNSGSATTAYTNGAPNDDIFIWCAEGLGTNSGNLTATPSGGSGPWTFEWYFHNQGTSSWNPLTTEVGASSTLTNLPSDGYRVQIYDNGGNLVGCDIAWVWNMNADVSASNSPTACNATNLSGAISAATSFSYYNPPPPESIISSNTTITVCFSANHTFVSDLAFYLVGPAACGSPTIPLSPNPGSIGQGSVCNSGNNVNNLCFTTTPSGNLNVCTAGTPLSGTYSSYGASSTPINWSSLYGCNAAQGGWSVQIYDCIGLDVGSLTNATISFSNLTSVCGSPTSITYNSGAINSAINDNSCSAGTASIFQVPVSPILANPITINATTAYQWTSNPAVAIPNSTSSLTPSVTAIPTGTTQFYLTATVAYGGTNCVYVDSTSFTNTCCTAVADAGPDVNFCTGGSATLGTPSVAGMTYAWTPITDLTGSSTAQPTVSMTNAGSTPQSVVYTLTVTNVVDGGCTDTDAVTVTVHPNPTVSAGTYGPVCENVASVALAGSPAGGLFSGSGVVGSSFNPSAGTQLITYNYTDANGCSGSATTTITVNPNPLVNAGNYPAVCIDAPAVALAGSPAGGSFSGTGVSANSFNPASGTQTITYTYTDANGCTGSAGTTITVNPLPVVSAGNIGPVCENVLGVALAGNPIGGTYSGTGVSGNTFNPSVGTQTVTYTYTNANGCTNSATTTITVNPLPVVDAGAYGPVCPESAALVLAGSPAGGVFYGTGVSAGSFDPSYGTQTVTYEYTDANGCSNNDGTVITVYPQPPINGGADQTVCVGTAVTLSGAGGVAYVWTNGGIDGQPFVPGLGSTVYTVTGTDANGCTSTDQVTVTAVEEPVAVVSATTTQGQQPLEVTFTNDSYNATSYYWDFGNGASATVGHTGNQSTVYTEAGTYIVTLVASNGMCTADDTIMITVLPIPIPEIHVPNVFTPNGDGNNDQFFLETANATDLKLTIFNRWGNLIMELNGINAFWSGHTMNGNEASEGVYFFKYELTGHNGEVLEGHGNVTLVR